MSHFGRSGPPDIRDTYSLLVLNISFRTTADDLYPLFERYGTVVDVYVPRDRRTGDPRGFAFVRFKYRDEAEVAVDRLDGRVVDGREIMVQFAKYGPNAEPIKKGRIVEVLPKTGRSRSRSPRPRYRDDYRGRDYRRRSLSRDRGRYEYDRYYSRGRDYYRRSHSRSISPDYERRSRGRDYYSRSRSRSISPDYERRGRGRYDDYYYRRSRSRSFDGTPLKESRTRYHDDRSPAYSASPRDPHAVSRSPSPLSGDE